MTKILVLSFTWSPGIDVGCRRLFALWTGFLFHVWLRHGYVLERGARREALQTESIEKRKGRIEKGMMKVWECRVPDLPVPVREIPKS